MNDIDEAYSDALHKLELKLGQNLKRNKENLDALDAPSVSITQEDLLDDYQKWRLENGLPAIDQKKLEQTLPKVKTIKVEKKKAHTFTISDTAYKGLELLATLYNCRFGERISVSQFVEFVGQFKFRILPSNTPDIVFDERVEDEEEST